MLLVFIHEVNGSGFIYQAYNNIGSIAVFVFSFPIYCGSLKLYPGPGFFLDSLRLYPNCISATSSQVRHVEVQCLMVLK